MRNSAIYLLASALLVLTCAPDAFSAVKPQKTRLTLPAKSLTFFPYYFGKDKRFFEEEGLELELIIMRPPLGVTALQSGDLDYSAAASLSMRAALKGAPLRALMFIQTRLSFSLVGQPGMTAQKISTVGVSGLGSLAHYAGRSGGRKNGRGGGGGKAAEFHNTTTRTE